LLDEQTLVSACSEYVESLKLFYPGEALAVYACKAWSNPEILKVINRCGMGCDVVSLGEMHFAMKARIPMENVVFHGNNKSELEVLSCIQNGATLVVDGDLDIQFIRSCPEAILRQSPKKVVEVLVRVVPGIEIHTHENIRTGHFDSKFGFPLAKLWSVLEILSRIPYVRVLGLHAHIGSQSFESNPHADVAALLLSYYAEALKKGLSEFTVLNLGGGLGVRYKNEDDPPSIKEWVQKIALEVVQTCAKLGLKLPKLICEPGRSIICNSCCTLYTIGSIKTTASGKEMVAVDGGMSDNPRPITYQAKYSAEISTRLNEDCTKQVTVVGKHCESGDVLIKDLKVPAATSTGDILTVFCTGAYNASMASNYNQACRPAAVMHCLDGSFRIIRRRETLEDLCCLIPDYGEDEKR
jgi:diaminopimelate decarboxylase